jgi:DNA-binding ferritin-like protein
MTKENNLEKGKMGASKGAADSRLAAVRDLIFGENIQQYEISFDEVYEKIAALRGESDKKIDSAVTNLENKIEALKKASEASLEKLTSDMEKKISNLEDAKADRKKLGKALEKIALMLQG